MTHFHRESRFHNEPDSSRDDIGSQKHHSPFETSTWSIFGRPQKKPFGNLFVYKWSLRYVQYLLYSHNIWSNIFCGWWLLNPLQRQPAGTRNSSHPSSLGDGFNPGPPNKAATLGPFYTEKPWWGNHFWWLNQKWCLNYYSLIHSVIRSFICLFTYLILFACLLIYLLIYLYLLAIYSFIHILFLNPIQIPSPTFLPISPVSDVTTATFSVSFT